MLWGHTEASSRRLWRLRLRGRQPAARSCRACGHHDGQRYASEAAIVRPRPQVVRVCVYVVAVVVPS